MRASNDGGLDQGGGTEVWGEVAGPHTGSIVRVKPMGFADGEEKTIEDDMVFRLSTSKGGEESRRKSYEEREDTQELGS